MPVPVEVAFKNMDRSAALEARVQEKAEKLASRFASITHLRVLIEAPHLRHQQGNLFDVRIDIRVPGSEIAITREAAKRDPSHVDVYVALRDAFAAATRKLQAHDDRQSRHDVRAFRT